LALIRYFINTIFSNKNVLFGYWPFYWGKKRNFYFLDKVYLAKKRGFLLLVFGLQIKTGAPAVGFAVMVNGDFFSCFGGKVSRPLWEKSKCDKSKIQNVAKNSKFCKNSKIGQKCGPAVGFAVMVNKFFFSCFGGKSGLSQKWA